MSSIKESLRWLWIFQLFMWVCVIWFSCQVNDFSDKVQLFEERYEELLGKPTIIDAKYKNISGRFSKFESLIYDYNCEEK